MASLFAMLSLWITLSPIQATPKVVNKIYPSGKEFQFIDINGQLSTLVNFEAEVIAEGFGFLEGPMWVDDYLLFTEPKTEPFNIWKYDPKTNKLEIWPGKYPGCGNGIAWNKNYPDELWIACMHGGDKVIHVNKTTYQIIDEYNHKTYHPDRDGHFQANDIVLDDNGNIYFTDMPLDRNNEIGARGGVYHIDRDTKKMTLITLMEYAPNGISLNNDQTMIAVANFADVPIEKLDILDYNQHNWDNVNIIGYKKHPANNPDTALLDQPFVYFNTNKEPFFSYMLHDKYDMFFDGSAFDMYDNLWQSVYFNYAIEGGQISIVKNDGNTDSDVEYIGSIRNFNLEHTPSNLEQGKDGYMYVTCGRYDDNIGTLLRFKIKEQYKEEL